MNHNLTSEDRKKIIKAIADGDRIEAVNIYMPPVKCGLTEAQDAVKAMTEELNQEKLEGKHRRER